MNILCDGKTGEGDGIDSNGWLVINGGTVIAQACATSGDAGIDSDKGIYINGGKVIASGNMLDHIAGGEQTYAVFSFASRQVGDSTYTSTYTLKNADGQIVGEYAPRNDFTYLLVTGDELIAADYTFWQGDTQLSASSMSGMPQGERPQMPNGEQQPEMPEDMERPEEPNGERPQRPESEIPQKPEGMENMTPPNGMGGMMGGFGMGNMMNGGTNSPTFTIVKGGNQFRNVSPVATTPTE